MKITRTWLVLLVIICLASFLRLYHLDTNPPSPYWEETALGYDAYSISQTGKDFHGNPYPILAFPSFGDYKPSGYFYAEVPFIKALGLNLLAVRLPAALAGILCVALIFLVGKELFGPREGFIASALLAISPWGIQFSRGGWEVNLAMTCVVAGCYFLLLARRKFWALPFAVLVLGYSMYTYHAARVYAPLIGIIGGVLLLQFWINEKRSNLRRFGAFVFSLALALIIVLPLLVNLKSSSVSSRFDATSIFTDPAPVLQSNQLIQAHGNSRVAKLIYHRYWFYGAILAEGFIKHFSPNFLFVRGDGNLRHSTVAFGLFYPVDAFFMLISLVCFIRTRNPRVLLLVISILLAGIAPALVTPTPHALRFLFALPGFTLLVAFGIARFTERRLFTQLRSRKIGAVIIYVLFITAFFVYEQTQYPIKAASDWQYGYKELYADLKQEKQLGEQVYVTREQGRPSMYYLFYSVYDPAKIQAAGSHLPKDQLELLQVDDYNFVDALPPTKGLFATSPEKVDPNAKVLATVKNLNGSIVWEIWRRN